MLCFNECRLKILYLEFWKFIDPTHVINSNSNSEAGDYSIYITGEYLDANEAQIPFSLISAFDQTVQLPIAGGGVTVEADSSVHLSVVLDLKTCIDSLDFASATVSNNTITIDALNNQDTYWHTDH